MQTRGFAMGDILLYIAGAFSLLLYIFIEFDLLH